MRIHTADGWPLAADLRIPAQPWGVAVVGHAMMVDRRSMDRPQGEGLCTALHAAGLVVVNADFRGHGESATLRRGFDFEAIARFDVPALLDFVAERWPALPRFVFGHSLGANATLLSMARTGGAGLTGLVALAPNLWLPRHEPSAARRRAKSLALRAWDLLSMPTGQFDPRPAGMGTSRIPRAYVRQFARWWRDDALRGEDGFDYMRALADIDVPVLAYSSSGDRLMAHPDAVAGFLSLLRSAPVDHRIVRGPGAPDHMGWVTSEGRRDWWTHAIAWMRERAAAVTPPLVTDASGS